MRTTKYFLYSIIFVMFYTQIYAKDKIKIILKDAIYQGTTINGKATGYGTIKYKAKREYAKEFNKLTGIYGVYEKDVAMGFAMYGSKTYIGNVKDGMPNGKGKMLGIDTSYDGE